MGLHWEEPSPDLSTTFAGRSWPVTLAGDRGQPTASSRTGDQEQDPAPLVPRLVLIHPVSLFAFFLTRAGICSQGLKLICTSHICQLRPEWCRLINREVFNKQTGFKTPTQPNNSKIYHKLQQSHSQPSSQGSCIHPRVLENNNKKAKIWERRIKNTLEDGMKTPISRCSTIPSPPEHPYDRDDSPRPGTELPPLCHS